MKHYPFLMEHWPQFLGLEAYHVLRMLPALGLQDGLGGADVRVDRGIVTHLDYGVLVRGSGGWVLGRKTVEDEAVPKYVQDRMADRSYYLRYSTITTEGGGEAIESRLTPRANEGERERAYDLDFDCLTRVGGCTSLCQLAPAAFADLVRQDAWMPWLDEHDPNCAKLKALAANPDNGKHP